MGKQRKDQRLISRHFHAACLAAIALATSIASTAVAEGWAEDVVYFVMLDRFADGDPFNNAGVDVANPLAFHGGDLQGLTQKLPEIADLGATSVWLTPIVEQVGPIDSEHGPFHGHHGYWANSFTRIDPRFGTEDDLRALVEQAHGLGLKVILDVVYNHVGYDAEWTRTRPDWLRQGDDCGGSEETLCLAGLPDLRTELPEVRDYLFDAHIGLAERVGLDGFRLDTVKHISHDFWQAHAAEVRDRLGPDFLLLGEVWDADKYLAEPYLAAGEMDAITDFGFRDRTLKYLSGVSDAARYGRYLAKRHAVPEGGLLAPFLSNHDMPTLLAMLRGDTDKLKVAATLLLTSEGLPVLAWGEEVGRRGGLWPDNREDMPWGEKNGIPRDEDLRAHFQQLIALRRAHPALAAAEIEIIHAEGRTLAYTRGSDALVLVNAGTEPWTFAADGFAAQDWTLAYQSNAENQGFTVAGGAASVLLRSN